MSRQEMDNMQLAIIDAIGMDAFIKLSNVVGGNSIYIVKFERLTMHSRNRKIYESYTAGASCIQLSAQYRLTKKYIMDIVKKMEKGTLNHVGTLQRMNSVQLDILETIGMDAYTELTKKFGGAVIYVAKLERLKIPQRNEAILERLSFGSNYSEVAKEYGLTERYIREIANMDRKGGASE